MKKLILGSLVLLFFTLIAGQPVRAIDVNNFTIENYAIDYNLEQDTTQHSILTTVETITARFPQDNQNHGVERLLPTAYDDHSTGLKITSVTDATGASLNYTNELEDGISKLRIGDPDTYVHGDQTYVITYTQRDVTKYFKDTNDDEFYWDTNGTGWQVPIKNLSVHLKLSDSVASSFTNNQRCYRGISGATESCDITREGSTFVTTAANLSSGENVTVAVGFKAHSFAVHTETFGEKFQKYFHLTQIATIPFAVLIAIGCIVAYERLTKRQKERGTIVAEYLPPRDINVTVSASIWGKNAPVFAAQLLDYAVRHYVKIYQTSEGSFWRKAKYELEIIRDISDLQAEEQELFKDMFSQNTAVGTRLDLSQLQSFSGRTAFAIAVQDNQKKLSDNIEKVYGLRAKNPVLSKRFYIVAGITLVLSLATVSIALSIAAVVSLICGLTLKPLTDRGLELWRYLAGLKEYITVAETDRLRMLQSPEGAQKVGASIDPNDRRQLVKLYERVLPYAVLFGQEKDWNKQLGQYYESLNQAPDWYVGNSAAFSAIHFSSAMNSFSSSATSIGGSSSTGGSSGGGSSGGGGGGGGGGGW